MEPLGSRKTQLALPQSRERLDLLPILDLRQEMQLPQVSKSFLSTVQASPRSL